MTGSPAGHLIMCLLVCGLAAMPHSLLGQAPACGAYEFVFDDVDRFAKALEAIEAGAEPVREMEAYLEEASPGLASWREIYGTNAEGLARALSARPRYFRSLVEAKGRYRALTEQIACGYDGLRAIRPQAFDPALPTYFFVTALSGGGSVRPVGVLIGLDYFGREFADPPEFPEGVVPHGSIPLAPVDAASHTAVHEMVHWMQLGVQGFDTYTSIYRAADGPTLETLAVREGGADFIASLVTGREPTRNDYVREHESELWTEFATARTVPASNAPGWFSGRAPGHPEWPWQIGYAMGFRVAEEYHRQAADSVAAVMTILAASAPAEVRAVFEPYLATRRKP